MMPVHPLERRVRTIIFSQGLFRQDSRVLIGCSGGADSTALLHILAVLREEFSLFLVAAYIDHGLRPLEVPAEIFFVHQTAAQLGIPCEVRSVAVRDTAKTSKISIEHAARELRYQAFAELSQIWDTQALALGHTADDQAEELLLRLLRGSGRKALSGMRVRSGHIIRPLLGISKRELLAYLADKKVSFCHDSSNDESCYLRNRIRHHLLPVLANDYDPGIRVALLKTAENLAEDEGLIEALLEEAWGKVLDCTTMTEEQKEEKEKKLCLLRKPFLALHPALQRRLLEKLLWHLGSVARYQHILILLEAARSGRNNSSLHLSRGLRVQICRKSLIFSYPKGQGPWRGELG